MRSSADSHDLLSRPVLHVDPTAIDARPLVDAYRHMSFQARNLARAADLYSEMLADQRCTIILTLAGSLVSAGLKQTFVTLIQNDMVDIVVSTGANAVDQDFFEGLGFNHYVCDESREDPNVSDELLMELDIDRIYDTYVDERELRVCDQVVKEALDDMEPGTYGSRELVNELGRWLERNRPGAESWILEAHRKRVPVFVPAFSDCSGGRGLLKHQVDRVGKQETVVLDSGLDLRELTALKVHAQDTGLFMLGGGVPKNFAQSVVVAAEVVGSTVPMHKYAIQISVADSRVGGLSGSTLREACSWGTVDVEREQMVFGEVTPLLPILVSDAWHRGAWRKRSGRRLAEVLQGPCAAAPGQPVR